MNTIQSLSRRHWLARCGQGMGALGLASLLSDKGLLAADAVSPAIGPLSPKPPHFLGKAKRVIWLFINGGPSQVDTWDYNSSSRRV